MENLLIYYRSNMLKGTTDRISKLYTLVIKFFTQVDKKLLNNLPVKTEVHD